MRVGAGVGRRRLARSCAELFWIALAAVLAIVALWLTLVADRATSFRCVPRMDLYQLAEWPRVAGFGFEPEGLLTVEMANVDETGWTRLGGPEARSTLVGRNPAFELPAGISNTVLVGERSGLAIEVRTLWGPGVGEPLVSIDGVRVGPASPYSIHDFVIPVSAYRASHVEAARTLMAPLALAEGASDGDRVAVLAAFLHDRLEPHRGRPAARMVRLNGLEQYREAMAGRSKVYCANHAEIYAFFANAAGLPTRVVDVVGRVGEVALGAHTFAETFLANERRWVYVDLQLHLAGVRGTSGNLLDAATLLADIRRGMTDRMVARTIQADRVVDVPYREIASSVETFLGPSATLAYLSSSPDRFSPIQKILRVFFHPRPALCEGAKVRGAERRLVVTWLAVACGIVAVTLRLRAGDGGAKSPPEGGG